MAASARGGGRARGAASQPPLEGYDAPEEGGEPGGRSGSVNETVTRSSDFEAELAVVAALLTTPECFFDVSERVSADDFADARLAEVYRAVLACDLAGKPFDQVTVADELKRVKQLTRIGGKEAIARIIDRGAPLITNVVAHADLIADLALKRRVALTARAIAAEALTPEMDGRAALEVAEARVFELGKGRDRSNMAAMTEIVPGMLQLLAEGRKSLLVGHSTGFSELDKMTAGWQPGQLIVIGARPAMGKSAFALGMARHIAETTGLVVPFLSYEMTKTELALRMLSASLGISTTDLRQGNIPSGADRDLAIAAEKMAGLPLFIDDQPPATIQGVRAQLRRMARRGELGAVFVDYLQLMDSERRSRDPNRVQEITDISKTLKRLATELEVPVIALSQLSRQLEGRADKRPLLSDLRESGSIEQDASVVLFLYRGIQYNQAEDPNLAECIIAKQRDGATGTVYLHFLPRATRFSDWTGPVPQQHGGMTGVGGEAGGRWGGGGTPF